MWRALLYAGVMRQIEQMAKAGRKEKELHVPVATLVEVMM